MDQHYQLAERFETAPRTPLDCTRCICCASHDRAKSGRGLAETCAFVAQSCPPAQAKAHRAARRRLLHDHSTATGAMTVREALQGPRGCRRRRRWRSPGARQTPVPARQAELLVKLADDFSERVWHCLRTRSGAVNSGGADLFISFSACRESSGYSPTYPTGATADRLANSWRKNRKPGHSPTDQFGARPLKTISSARA
jgi:hypothetical protein